ncbi:RNA methyltransferase [bacterium]|nr:RNA methyltransferase [bacterium]
MTPADPITSLQNPRVKRLVKLRERRHREREGVVLLDEARVIRRALDAGADFGEVYVRTGATGAAGADLAAALRDAGAELVELAPHVMAKAAYRDDPDGVLALCAPPATGLDALSLPADALVVVLENVEKPGNLGAVVRTASGAGVDAVLASGAGADPWNPNALRASTGAVFSVPLATASAAEIMDHLRRRSIRMVAADPEAGDSYAALDLTGPVAFVLGAEDAGLTAATRSAADVACRIPMRGAADSLNVSVSAAILVYEARRQRDGA